MWCNSTHLAHKAKVQDRVNTIIKDNRVSALHDAAKVREFVLRGLHREATQGDSSAARIRAMELLGKLDVVGMFQDRKETTVRQQRPSDEILSDLRQKLETLHLTARDITPSDLLPISQSQPRPQSEASDAELLEDADGEAPGG